MLYQENDPELYDRLLTTDGRLTRFRKVRDRIVGRVKGSDSPCVKGTQYYEKDLVVWEMGTIRNESSSVSKSSTNWNHAGKIFRYL